MIGTIVAIKINGERVFVMREATDVEKAGWDIPAEQLAYKVRRPSYGRNGIVHHINVFPAEELETVEEYLRRDLDMMILKTELQQEGLRKAQEKADSKRAANPAEPKSFLN